MRCLELLCHHRRSGTWSLAIRQVPSGWKVDFLLSFCTKIASALKQDHSVWRCQRYKERPRKHFISKWAILQNLGWVFSHLSPLNFTLPAFLSYQLSRFRSGGKVSHGNAKPLIARANSRSLLPSRTWEGTFPDDRTLWLTQCYHSYYRSMVRFIPRVLHERLCASASEKREMST